MNSLNIHLVITAALKKELPLKWLQSRNIPVHTLAALKSGALSLVDISCTGMLVVITGVGLEKSEEAACWIKDNLTPLYVLNIGTCGLINKKLETGRWYMAGPISNEERISIECEPSLPVPAPEDLKEPLPLLSVTKYRSQNFPSYWSTYHLLDMESFAQAKVFRKTAASFHCLKFATDYSDRETISDFNKNLGTFHEELKKLFFFLPGLYGKNGDESVPFSVTAIIPVYNREKSIRKAIDSVLSQTLLPTELIVVDDCSTDRTGEIIGSYGNQVRLISSNVNSGPSIARNMGIAETSTEWIAFLDSDDYWEKDKLQKQADYLKKYPFYQIIQSDEKWIRNGKRVNPCKHHKKPLGWIWEPSLERCLVSPSGVIIKKSLINSYDCFDEGLPACEDYDLWLKISRHHPVGLEPDLSVVKHGGHDDQLSRKFPAMDRFRVQSLYNILQTETDIRFKEKIISILRKKLNILITGYKKRNNKEELSRCITILKSLTDSVAK